jgi:hypothetical protein
VLPFSCCGKKQSGPVKTFCQETVAHYYTLEERHLIEQAPSIESRTLSSFVALAALEQRADPVMFEAIDLGGLTVSTRIIARGSVSRLLARDEVRYSSMRFMIEANTSASTASR